MKQPKEAASITIGQLECGCVEICMSDDDGCAIAEISMSPEQAHELASGIIDNLVLDDDEIGEVAGHA